MYFQDMGFALCLIAAALICFDLLFLEKGEVRFARLRAPEPNGAGSYPWWQRLLLRSSDGRPI